MRIRTLEKNYEILLKISEDQRSRIVIAREAGSPPDSQFLLDELKKGTDIHAFLPFCEEQKKNEPFDDFVEYFSLNGSLYLVFQNPEGENFKKWLETYKTSLEERLRGAKSLLQNMVFLNMPPYLQYEALNFKNLVIDKNSTIQFCYGLYEPERLENVTSMDIWSRVGEIFTELFLVELSDKSCPSIERFVELMEKGNFTSYLEAYRAFAAVYEKTFDALKKNEIKPQGPGARMKEKGKALLRFLRYLLVAAVLASLVCYLIYTALHPQSSGEPVDFEQIGTLEITDSHEANTN